MMDLSLTYPCVTGLSFRLARTRPVFIAVTLFLTSGLIFAILILSAPGFFSTDDYYHVQVAREILNQGTLRLDFPWLPLTILSQDRFVDHHLLFHLFLTPFIHFGGASGARWAMVVIGAAIAVTMWLLFTRARVLNPALWALAIFSLSSPFLYRLLMVRAQGPALLILILVLLALVTSRYRWLIILGFAFTWLYNGFILIIAVAGLWSALVWLQERRVEVLPVAYVVAGIALGLLINPYFPQNIEFILNHLLAKVDFQSGVSVGREWYPYNTEVFVTSSAGAMLALLGGLIMPGVMGHRRSRVENFLLAVTLLTLFMAVRSRRFIEYFPAFALIFAAVAVGGHVSLVRIIRLQPWPRLLVSITAILGAFLLTASTLSTVAEDARSVQPEEYFAGAAGWLQRHTPPGTLVFQTDWDDFPRLYYHNTSNVYLVGMDPTYLTIADPDLYHLWTQITQGQIQQPSALISTLFKSRYVVSDTQHGAFAEQARTDEGMELVYRDQDSYIWRITVGEQGPSG